MCSLTYEIITAKTKGNTEYNKIKKLNCWASNLNDVSILKHLTNIEVLTLSVNEISSLESVQYCVNLIELYIRNNKITNLDEIYYLKNLKKLKILWLADNPVSQDDNYRLTVIKNLKNLQKLDNISITNEERLNAIKFGKEIKRAPFKLDDEKNDSNENLLDINCSTQDFDDLIKPLKDRCSIQENDQSDENNATNKSNEFIVTTVDNTDDNTVSTILNLKTLESNSDCIYNVNFDISSNANKSKSNDKLSSESNDDSQKTSESSNNNVSSIGSSSNVLPAILLLINELSSDDLKILINMCIKRQDELNKL